MADVVSIAAPGAVFLDARGPDRALRATWHSEADTLVLSLWQLDRCVGSFRLDAAEVPALIQTLVDGLATYVEPGRHARSVSA